MELLEHVHVMELLEHGALMVLTVSNTIKSTRLYLFSWQELTAKYIVISIPPGISHVVTANIRSCFILSEAQLLAYKTLNCKYTI